MTDSTADELFVTEIHEQLAELFLLTYEIAPKGLSTPSKEIFRSDTFYSMLTEEFAKTDQVLQSGDELLFELNYFLMEVEANYGIEIPPDSFNELLTTRRSGKPFSTWQSGKQHKIEFTLWTLAEFIAVYLTPYRGKPVNICGLDSLEAGVFLGIQRYINDHYCPDISISPSMLMSQVIPQEQLDQFWSVTRRIHWRTLPVLNLAFRPFSSSVFIIGVTLLVIGIVLFISGIRQAGGPFWGGFLLTMWAIRMFRLSGKMNYWGAPIPSQIRTLGDLAKFIVVQKNLSTQGPVSRNL